MAFWLPGLLPASKFEPGRLWPSGKQTWLMSWEFATTSGEGSSCVFHHPRLSVAGAANSFAFLGNKSPGVFVGRNAAFK